MGGENRRYCNPKDLWRGYAILCIGFLYKSTNWGKGGHIGPLDPNLIVEASVQELNPVSARKLFALTQNFVH